MAEALEVQKPWEFAAVHRCLSKTWKNNRLRRLDVCLHHPFLSEGNDKNRQKRRKRRKLWGEDTAIAFCRKGPLEDLKETPPKYRELSLSQKHLNTSRHEYGMPQQATAIFLQNWCEPVCRGRIIRRKWIPSGPNYDLHGFFNDLQHAGTLQKTAKSGHSHHENCLRQAVRIFCDLVQWIAAREHPKQRQQVTWSQAAKSTAMSLAVEGCGTVSHISQLSKMFQCFTSCLKSQAAAPMPPSQLRTFTLSDGDSLEPRVSDVGALPINAMLSQSTAMASTKLDHANSCQEKPLHELSLLR